MDESNRRCFARHKVKAFILPITLLFTVACGSSDDLEVNPEAGESTNENSTTEPSGGDEAPVETSDSTLLGDRHESCATAAVVGEAPADATEYIQAGFTRYAQIVAPNGGIIKIFGAPATGDERIRRAHSLMSFYLKDVPGSEYGATKAEVANRMASNNAVLVMPTGADGEGPEVRVEAQPLFEDETPVEGSTWYMQNDWEHRDAAFEEIFHLVHDTGIGTYLPGALPEYQSRLGAEAEAAIADGRWGIAVDSGVSNWLQDLRQEDSLAQEYIASVIDSYYGLWAPWDEAAGGMWGIYIAKSREEIAEKDPVGLSLLEAFLAQWLDYEVHLASELDGDFHLAFDASKPYTHKSQYLLHVTLTGSNPSNVFANAQDNTLRGNAAANILDGAQGQDTAVYCDSRSAYSVSRDGNDIVIEGPDGRDVLKNIEIVHFADGAVLTSDL